MGFPMCVPARSPATSTRSMQQRALCRWVQRKHVRDVAGIGRLQRHASELLGYLERNEGALVHYAARRRCGEPISTAFVESAVNEIVAKRMNPSYSPPNAFVTDEVR
jgi:hypothetical protein